jgi:hypothetical protein
MKTTLVPKLMILGIGFAALAATATVADAAGYARFAYANGQAGVSVWIEGGDVFADYSDVAIWLRPEHDCFTTLFMVDTDGFVHVLYPGSPYDDTWLYGGRAYCFRGYELGLDRFDGAGIAYVFAVGSPEPFDYSYYDASVFVDGFGFRVYGDPFVACRDFYMTLLPSYCRWDYVGVSYAHFYVRHWARYPSYLCYGGPGVHVFVGDACNACRDVYVSYRASCAHPWNAFQPAPKFKQKYATAQVYYDGNRGSGYAQAGRVQRADRAFKASRGESVQGGFTSRTVKQFDKASGRSFRDDVVMKRAAKDPASRTTATRAVRAPEKKAERATQRVISTSSARERRSVDQASVAALSKRAAKVARPASDTHVSQAMRASRSSDTSKRATVAEKSTRGQSAREKGNKKKQAR